MTIEIKALDTLIFQDGKPFDKASDNWSNSLVLPNPSTIYGALRAIYFAKHPNELSKANEEDDPTKNLKINFIGLMTENNLLFKIPKDCVELENEVKTLALKENILTSNLLKYILFSDDEVENIENGYLKFNNFKKYLMGKPITSFEKEEDYIIKESKIGIGLNKQTKTVQESLLYRVEMLRYKNLKIIVDFEGLNIDKKGLMKLGGEAKAATFKRIDNLTLPKIENISNNIFKLYLITPAIFENGWYPKWIDKDSDFIGSFKDFKLKLVAVANGKYHSIGGFDIKKKKPKEMLKATPSGSVYYFEILEGDKQNVIDTFHLISISDQKENEGFGIVMVGDVK